MKYVLLLLICCFCLGCNSKWTGEIRRDYYIVNNAGSPAVILSGDGVYSLEFLTDKGNEFCLTYKQHGSDEAQTICWLPNCTHRSLQCPAYYGSNSGLLSADQYRRAYLIEYTNNGIVKIVCVDPANARKTELVRYELLPNTVYSTIDRYCLVGHELYLQLTYSQMGQQMNNESTLFRIDLRSDKVETVLKAEKTLCLNMICQDRIYMEASGEQGSVLIEYSAEGEKMREFRGEPGGINVTPDHQMIYKAKQGDQWVWVSESLENGQCRVVADTTEEALAGKSYMLYGGYMTVMLESLQDSLYWLNLTTGEKIHWQKDQPASVIMDAREGRMAIKTGQATGRWRLRIQQTTEAFSIYGS